MPDRVIIEDLRSDRWRLTRHIGANVGCDSHGYMAWVEPFWLRAYGDTEQRAVDRLRKGIGLLCDDLLGRTPSCEGAWTRELREWLMRRVERKTNSGTGRQTGD